MKLKTAPRVILGLLLVGGAMYGVNIWMDKRAVVKPQPEQMVQQPVVQQPVTVPVQQEAQPAQQPAAQPQPAPASPDRRHDAGLNALINGGSK